MAPGTERSNTAGARALCIFSIVGATDTLRVLGVDVPSDGISCYWRDRVVETALIKNWVIETLSH